MIFKNFNIIYRDGIKTGDLLIRDGIIKGEPSVRDFDIEDIIDGEGKYLSPGFIDVHIHGAGGKDTMDGKGESLEIISKTIASYGTTSFLPTTMTQEESLVRKAVDCVREYKDKVTGAKILGIHMEGPFVNPSPSTIGAQNPKFVQKPSIDSFKTMTGENEDLITTVTLAPELEGAKDLIHYLRDKNINASMGHTAATYEEAIEGIKEGINHSTHIFNTMTGLHHRKPGSVGAILDSDITTETISDGIHVVWPMLRLVYNSKGSEKVILVTDAMMACGMHDGNYTLGGQKVIKKGLEARLENGALAGSVLTMDKAVKNVHNNSSIPLHEVINMASYNPAVLCNVEKERGEIKPGLKADLLILSKDLEVERVFIEGQEFKTTK